MLDDYQSTAVEFLVDGRLLGVDAEEGVPGSQLGRFINDQFDYATSAHQTPLRRRPTGTIKLSDGTQTLRYFVYAHVAAGPRLRL